jgi:protein-L-isoaspartate(D-aspartate) O-methyltransferase
MDNPQSIGYGVTISAPHMHAKACEAVVDFLKPGARVLDVGSGSGYLTHVLAELVKPGGTVVGVEHIQPLVDLAHRNTAKSAEGRELLANGSITYVKADGRKGWTGKGGEEGYDVIHVGAAAVGFHQELIDQLKKPGR